MSGAGAAVPSRWRVPAIVGAYLAVFWAALPAVLWWFGGLLDRLLALPALAGAGWVVVGVGLAVVGNAWLGWAVWVLWRRGAGWPISHLPPRVLVTTGPYAVARHPIYAGYTIAFAGLGLAGHSLGRGVLAALALAAGAVVYARGFEEPRLRRRYGDAYDACGGTPFAPWPAAGRRRARRRQAAARPLDLRWRLASLAAGYAVFCATYLPINLYSAWRGGGHILFLPGEAAIPFVPAMEYCYALGYVAPVLAACGLPDWARLRRLARAFALTLTVAYATYLVYPVYFERPVLQVDTLATWLLSLEYLDKSYNHFPSLHVAITWLMYLACRDRPAGRALLVAALVVPVSTVFVKQHYVVDVAYGVALAAVAWRASRGGAVAA